MSGSVQRRWNPIQKRLPNGEMLIYAVGPNGTLTTSTTLDKPLLSSEGMTGFIVFEVREGSSQLPGSLPIGNRGLSPICAVYM